MGKLIPGLVSVTFRPLSPREIVDLAARAGLQAIEWGGDIHVPHGNVQRAQDIGRMTRDEGLQVAAYGSYYRVWPIEPVSFEQVLETALALGAPLIRVWAGKQGSADTGPADRQRVITEARRIANLAAQAGITVAFEHHGGTLTDTHDSTIDLLTATGHPNLGCYWQPPTHQPVEERRARLTGLLPWLRSLHVFQWQVQEDSIVRLPLSAGEAEWIEYLSTARSTDRDLFALIEFVQDDSPQRFLEDADTLLNWVSRV